MTAASSLRNIRIGRAFTVHTTADNDGGWTATPAGVDYLAVLDRTEIT